MCYVSCLQVLEFCEKSVLAFYFLSIFHVSLIIIYGHIIYNNRHKEPSGDLYMSGPDDEVKHVSISSQKVKVVSQR